METKITKLPPLVPNPLNTTPTTATSAPHQNQNQTDNMHCYNHNNNDNGDGDECYNAISNTRPDLRPLSVYTRSHYPSSKVCCERKAAALGACSGSATQEASVGAEVAARSTDYSTAISNSDSDRAKGSVARSAQVKGAKALDNIPRTGYISMKPCNDVSIGSSFHLGSYIDLTGRMRSLPIPLLEYVSVIFIIKYYSSM